MQITHISNFTNGWIIGNFDPSVLKTEKFEIALMYHKKDESWPAHYHKIATEYNVIIKGKELIQGVELNPGDVFIIGPYEVADPIFLEDCEVLVVKVPSVPGDKYMVK
jgi:quercetin dioxygenase-like cupin family protein